MKLRKLNSMVSLSDISDPLEQSKLNLLILLKKENKTCH